MAVVSSLWPNPLNNARQPRANRRRKVQFYSIKSTTLGYLQSDEAAPIRERLQGDYQNK